MSQAGTGGVVSGRRRIGPVDTIWLNMDRPNNLMVIDCVVFFDEPVDWNRLLSVLRRRLVGHFPVFRQRPVPARTPVGQPHWEDDPDFSLERHIHRARLPAPGDDTRLRRYIESQLRRPLERGHPLWELHFIDGYRDGAALFARLHHALADGMALARVLLSLSDADPTGDLADSAGRSGQPRPDRAGVPGPAVRAAGAAWAAVGSATAGGARLVHTGTSRLVAGLPRLATPTGVGGLLVQVGRTAAIAHKLLVGRNPSTVLAGEPGIDKRAAWSRPVALVEIKRVGRLAEATVNDVLMGALAGAIADYLAGRGEAAPDLSTMVPVNVRAPDLPLPPELGNRFALVFLRLPSSVADPLARLAEAKRRMDVIKHSPEAALTFGLITAIGRSCERLERELVNFFAGKAIGVTTNVVGPPTARYVAGTRIAGLLAWVPTSGRQTVGVCIVTYDQTVRVGFKVDAAHVPDPERLARSFDRAVDELVRLTRGRTRRARTVERVGVPAAGLASM